MCFGECKITRVKSVYVCEKTKSGVVPTPPALDVARLGGFDGGVDEPLAPAHGVKEKLLRRQPAQVRVLYEPARLGPEIIRGVAAQVALESKGLKTMISIYGFEGLFQALSSDIMVSRVETRRFQALRVN
jgi:hypothetical protein